MKPHRWHILRAFPWAYCRACGLVRLNNHASETAARKACKAGAPE